jgi:hypothetical protein
VVVDLGVKTLRGRVKLLVDAALSKTHRERCKILCPSAAAAGLFGANWNVAVEETR